MGKRSRRRWREQVRPEPARPAGESPGQPRSAGPWRTGASRPSVEPREVEEMVGLAVSALRQRQEDTFAVLVGSLAACWDEETVTRSVTAAGSVTTVTCVPSIVERCLEEAVGAAWAHGWQPGDLPRAVGRKLSGRHVRLSVDTIAGEARRYAASADADPEWLRQLEEIEACVWWNGQSDHLGCWLWREGLDRTAGLRHALELLCVLWELPALPRLCAPPSDWGRGTGGAGGRGGAGRGGGCRGRQAVRGQGGDPRVLHRVRGLLAKAESTTFPDEAEALTAKAQQLMTRHAIDRAMIEPDGGPGAAPSSRRLGIDDPYASAKSHLLHHVAAASNCRVVFSKDLGFSTVFGFDSELDAVELLFTSLLVQATAGMAAAGADRAGGARWRSRSFRQSFLVGFAVRIGERLREAAATATEEAAADHGGRLLPVLLSRAEAVEQERDRAFPDLSHHRLGANDPAGWTAGRVAANLASLGAGPGLETARSA